MLKNITLYDLAGLVLGDGMRETSVPTAERVFFANHPAGHHLVRYALDYRSNQ